MCNVDLGPHLAGKKTHQVNKQVGETVCGGMEGGIFFLMRKCLPMDFRRQITTCDEGILSIVVPIMGPLLAVLYTCLYLKRLP